MTGVSVKILKRGINMKLVDLNIGGKVTLITAGVAFLSFFMNWFDIGFAMRNGFAAGTVFYIVCFLYPVIALLTGKKVNRILGTICGIIAIAATVNYITSHTMILYDTPLALTGTGAWVFMLAAAGLIVATLMGAGPRPRVEE